MNNNFAVSINLKDFQILLIRSSNEYVYTL